MAILELVNFPDPVLKMKAKPVKTFDKSLQRLINDMFETLHSTEGVGLAAPQIGQSLRLAVIEYIDEEKGYSKPKRYVIVNPEIIETSEENTMETEGCLSLPNLAGNVERPKKITIKAKNRYGQPMKIVATGQLARIFQHEIDHLNGVLYIDKAKDVFSIK